MVKMALITVLFIAALIEQVSNTGLYANSFGTQEHMTVILLLIHTFSYSDFYQNIFFSGFIFLIPDIVNNVYRGNRNTGFFMDMAEIYGNPTESNCITGRSGIGIY